MRLDATVRARAAWLWSRRTATLVGSSAAAMHGSLWLPSPMAARSPRRRPSFACYSCATDCLGPLPKSKWVSGASTWGGRMESRRGVRRYATLDRPGAARRRYRAAGIPCCTRLDHRASQRTAAAIRPCRHRDARLTGACSILVEPLAGLLAELAGLHHPQQ